MPRSLSPIHHGIEHLLDAYGETLGQVERDRFGNGWIVSACPERFATRASLPAVFGGCFELQFPVRGDLLRFFDIPLPGEAGSDILTAGRRHAA